MMSHLSCRSVLIAALRLALVSATFSAPAIAQAPDTALVNGKIITLDERSTVAEALAVRDGKIAAVGRSAVRPTSAAWQGPPPGSSISAGAPLFRA
jgi:hypothetical protein